MASGCILGDCYICGMPVFEDEVKFSNDYKHLRHSYCKTSITLKQENEMLKRELEEYKRFFER